MFVTSSPTACGLFICTESLACTRHEWLSPSNHRPVSPHCHAADVRIQCLVGLHKLVRQTPNGRFPAPKRPLRLLSTQPSSIRREARGSGPEALRSDPVNIHYLLYAILQPIIQLSLNTTTFVLDLTTDSYRSGLVTSWTLVSYSMHAVCGHPLTQISLNILKLQFDDYSTYLANINLYNYHRYYIIYIVRSVTFYVNNRIYIYIYIYIYMCVCVCVCVFSCLTVSSSANSGLIDHTKHVLVPASHVTVIDLLIQVGMDARRVMAAAVTRASHWVNCSYIACVQFH